MIYINNKKSNDKCISFSKAKDLFPIAHLAKIQLDSYKQFLQEDISPSKRKPEGLQSVFLESFPIENASKDVVLEFVEYSIGKPKRNVWESKISGTTYAVPFKALVRLVSVETGEVREQEVYMGDLPIMTSTGTFVFNGAERVVVSQLHRSPGIFIFYDDIKGMYTARIIPDHKGSWLEFELDAKGLLVARIDRRKKFPFTLLLKCLGYNTNEEILRFFYPSEKIIVKDASTKELYKYLDRRVIHDVVNPKTKEMILEAGQSLNEDNLDIIKESQVKEIDLIIKLGIRDDFIVINSLEKDGIENIEDAFSEFLKIQRPLEYVPDQGDKEKREKNIERAKLELDRLFFNRKSYDMGVVGRYKVNSKFKHRNPKNFGEDVTSQVLRVIDIAETLKYMIYAVNEVEGYPFDDIDHLGNRRVRTVSELLTIQFKTGFSRMERIVKERMSMNDITIMTPQLLVSIKPISAVINEFFGTSQLSQFMDQVNPLSELTHKRRLNALGPGGLTRERAGFEVRDVHYTHYGRLCPIETPEGPNIGLIISIAVYARLNPYGFLETPYKVIKGGKDHGKTVYMSANEEDHYVVAQANSKLGAKGEFLDSLVSCRYRGDFPLKNPDEIHLMDVSSLQVVSLSAGLIPFLEHDDANRALMGSNMQRQAVPLLKSEAPLVGTGLEKIISYDSGTCLLSENNGVAVTVNADEIEVLDKKTKKTQLYPLSKFKRTNQSSCIDQIPFVRAYKAPENGKVLKVSQDEMIFKAESGTEYIYPMKGFQNDMELLAKKNTTVEQGTNLLGEKVQKEKIGEGGEKVSNATILADGHSTSHGRLALGKNIQVAFMPWNGYNFEDAIIVSEKLVKSDTFTSVTIEEFEIQTRETKLGRETITRDIPNINERSFRNLDEEGIIRIGAEVQAGDILVGMVTPKGQTDLTPEYRLLHSIFGEKAREVKDSSLRVPNGHGGIVIDIKSFSREADDELPAGINEIVKVSVAQKRKLSVGDKMAGRHGNKGVISAILPEHDMPFLPDGTPIDIILNPLGVPSRMNIGQIFETQLGWVAKELGVYFETPVFEGTSWNDIQKYMEKANLPKDSKVFLRDAFTGEPFKQPVFVGVIYMMKLSHMAEDKMHARSTGPYSLVTQQPLGGKAQFGGQRMGEMEVWALEAYGAAHTLQELLTVKSDDMLGRIRVYESIVKGIYAIKPGIPESFNVLVKEIRSLGLDISIIDSEGESVEISDLDDNFEKARKRIKIDSISKI